METERHTAAPGELRDLQAAGKTAPLIDRMQKEAAAVLGDETLRARLLAQGAEPAVGTSAQFGDFMKAQRESYARIVKEANVTVDP